MSGWVAGAIVVGSVVGAGASMYAGNKSADAQKSAAATASNTELEMYYQSREDTAPWREAGERGLTQTENLLAAGPGKFEASPGYEFVKSEGLKGINNALSARGKVDSGQAAKEAGRYVTGLASQEYGNFWNRYQDKLRGYQSLSGIGQSTAQQNAQNALATGQNVAGLQAAGISGAGNAQAAGIMGAGNAVNQGVGNYMLYKALAKA